MDPLPKVTAASIRQQASADSYHRGREYCTAGRETEWQAYLAELLTRYRRKYSLMPRLEALQR